MLIWVCDACGQREGKPWIVGNEFGWDDLGFGSYKTAIDGKHDFCAKCLGAVSGAISQFEDERARSYGPDRAQVARTAVKKLTTPSIPPMPASPLEPPAPPAEKPGLLKRIAKAIAE